MSQEVVESLDYLPKGTVKTVELNMGGQKVKVRTDATPAFLKQVQELVETKFSTSQSSMVVALNLAEELLQERERLKFFKRQVLERSERLLDRVESHLHRMNQ